MVERRSPSRAAALVVAGIAGVVLAHGLDYLLLFRSPARRAAELAATGHGWWAAGVSLGVAAAVVAVAVAAARGASAAAAAAAVRVTPGGTMVRGRDLPFLAAGQAGLFALVEVAERLGAHRSPAELLQGPLFAVGVLLQVVVAAAAVAVLRRLERAAATVATGALVARARRRPARRATGLTGWAPPALLGDVVGRGRAARAPPFCAAR